MYMYMFTNDFAFQVTLFALLTERVL